MRDALVTWPAHARDSRAPTKFGFSNAGCAGEVVWMRVEAKVTR